MCEQARQAGAAQLGINECVIEVDRGLRCSGLAREGVVRFPEFAGLRAVIGVQGKLGLCGLMDYRESVGCRSFFCEVSGHAPSIARANLAV